MKSLIVFSSFFVFIFGAPVDDAKMVTILRYDNDNNGLGTYKFAFETSDGHSRQEQGELKNIAGEDGAEASAVVVSGSFSFIGDDGETYSVNYIADENGYQPTVEHVSKTK